jgi:hypothetical protein
MTTTPDLERTPAENKARALKSVGRAVQRREKAQADELLAMRIANAAGASLRDLAEVTGYSHATVDRVLKRSEDGG